MNNGDESFIKVAKEYAFAHEYVQKIYGENVCNENLTKVDRSKYNHAQVLEEYLQYELCIKASQVYRGQPLIEDRFNQLFNYYILNEELDEWSEVSVISGKIVDTVNGIKHSIIIK